MGGARHFKITLPAEEAQMVESKVKSGAYASADDVLRAGVRALAYHDDAVEHWLRHDVVAGHEEYLQNPTAAVAASDILPRIKARRAHAGNR